MTMDDDVASDMRREALGLIRAFLGIADAGKRQRIIALAEQLADDSEPDAAALALAPTDPSCDDVCRKNPGQPE